MIYKITLQRFIEIFVHITIMFFLILLPVKGNIENALTASLFSFNINLAKIAITIIIALHVEKMKHVHLVVGIATLVSVVTHYWFTEIGIWISLSLIGIGIAFIALSFKKKIIIKNQKQ